MTRHSNFQGTKNGIPQASYHLTPPEEEADLAVHVHLKGSVWSKIHYLHKPTCLL